MQNITTSNGLKDAIRLLEIRQSENEIVLKEELYIIVESFKPLNLIKTTIKDFASSPDLIKNILGGVIGLATGIVSKKIVVGGSHNPIVRMLGTLIEIAVAGAVSKNPDNIKSIGLNLVNRIFGRGKEN